MSPWRSAFRRTLIYVIFGILWILYSDQLLATMVDDAAALTRLQTYKGWGFVIITGGLFMLLTVSAIRREHTLIARDKLTQLLNRYMFEQELEVELKLAAQGDKQIALVVLNIDNFRSINHAAGQRSGDWVLVQVADIIRQHCGDTRAVYARVAGDEFAIAIIDNEHYESVIERVRLIQRDLQNLTIPNHAKIKLSGGVGVACFPNDAENYRDLLTAANLALEEAKALGPGQLRLYDHFFGESVHSRLQLTNDLKQAISHHELSLVYQPQFDACNLTITGVEALLRWQHPQHGMVPPDVFIGIAEQQGFIGQITDFVCATAIRELQQAKLLGDKIPRLSINVSAHDFANEEAAACFFQRFQSVQNLACIQLELTETAIINNFENTLSILNKLQAAQINISIDDFGTGYSSLNVLRKLPIDEVKIDKAFIRDLQNSEEDRSIVRSILAMAHSLHLRVVAEGVEYNEQAQFLREQGCDELQGYLLAKPLAIGDLVYFCQQFTNSPECASPQLNALRNYMAAQEGFVPK